MKNKWIITTLAATGIIVAGAYAFGYSMGHQKAIGLCRSTLVIDLAALQNIRTNNIAEAIAPIEAHCYSDAVILLESPKWKNSSVIKWFIPELITYRKHYAADQAKWTYTEQRLEELLKKEGWKK